MLKSVLVLSLMLWMNVSTVTGQTNEPFKIAIIGLTHDHVHAILNELNSEEFEIVGIVETNESVIKRLKDRYGFSSELVFRSSDELLKKVKPDAVTAYGSTFQHLEVVAQFAPKGIHVMVEKPLAVNMEHASQMEKLAKENNIHLITNYETTWYSSNKYVHDLTRQKDKFGQIRKIVVHDGHQGPKEIGCSQDFLDWLTDPVLNGGGAVTDFGCYGANLATWLMNGEEPTSVSAVLQQLKPEMYPLVDDEATIIVTYPSAQVIIQASWNWPYNRKDMEVYGVEAYAFAKDKFNVNYKLVTDKKSKDIKLQELGRSFNNPFSYLKGVVNGSIQLNSNDLSSLENNMMVVKILDAAKESARTGKRIEFNSDEE